MLGKLGMGLVESREVCPGELGMGLDWTGSVVMLELDIVHGDSFAKRMRFLQCHVHFKKPRPFY